MLRTWILAVLVLALPIPAVAAEMLTPPAGPADDRSSVDDLFEGATPDQAQQRAALMSASWGLPEEVFARIQGAMPTDRENIESQLDQLVNPESANVRLPFLDLALGSYGPDAAVERTYNSQDRGASEFGRGWAWSFGSKLTQTGDSLTLREATGGEIVFEPAGERAWVSTTANEKIVLRSNGYLRTSTLEAEAERFSKDGWIVERIDANGHSLRVKRDRQGRPTAIVAANGRTLEIDMDRSGRIVSMTDPAGRKALYTYTDGRLTKTSIHGLETAYAYDADGALTLVTFPDASTLTVRYNQAGMVEEVRVGDIAVQAAFRVDPSQPGRHGAAIVTEDGTTRFQFDEKNGQARIAHADGAQEVRQADLSKGVVMRAAIGKTRTLYQRDDLGRIVQLRATDGIATFTYGPRALRAMNLATNEGDRLQTNYDEAGNLVRIAMENRIVDISYANGLPVEVKINGKTAVRNEYDRNGDLVALHDEKGGTIRIRYDAAGMVTALERVGAALVEIAPTAAAFVPNIRLSRKMPQGVRQDLLAQPEMAFLYGDLASARPSKRASLDTIPGVKFAGPAMLPAPAILAGCASNIFWCQSGYSVKCLGAEIANIAAIVGEPLKYNPETGEYEYDADGWLWNQIQNDLQEAAEKKAQQQLKKMARQEGGGWFRRATRWVGKTARNTWAWTKRNSRMIGKIGFKVGKKFFKLAEVIMLIPKAWECSTGVSDNAAKLCDTDRLCPEYAAPPPIRPAPVPAQDPAPDPSDATFLQP